MTEQWWHIVWRILLCWSLICLPFVRRDTNQAWAIQWFVFLFLFLPFFHSTVTLCPSLSNTIVVACFAHMYSHQDDDDDKRLQSSPSYSFFFRFFTKTHTYIYSIHSFTLRWKKEERKRVAPLPLRQLNSCIFFSSPSFSYSSLQ